MNNAKATLILLLGISTTAGAQVPRPATWPDVRCQLSGAHGADTDRMAASSELALLREAVIEADHYLPEDLREVSSRIVFIVAHRAADWTKLTCGWGPEDDGDYRYPDKKLYPEGTIKVNFTEKTLQAMALGRELGKIDAAAGRGARVFSRYIIAHELRHARQYLDDPLPDALALHRQQSEPGSCSKGLLDARLLAQAEKRLRYEKAAYAAHRELIEKGDLLAFAGAVENYEKEHSALFADGGKYHLLASKGSSPLVGKLREESAMTGRGGEFGPLAKLPNEGQVVPSRIVDDLKRLNDRLADSAHPWTEAEKAAAGVDAMQEQWKYFMTGENGRRVGKFLPCKQDEVEARYRTELARFESFRLPDFSATAK